MLTVHGTPTLSGIPPETRNDLYKELDKPTLGRLCIVAHQFMDEIYQTDYPSFKANDLAKHALSHLNDLLAYTQKHGTRIKCLNPILRRYPGTPQLTHPPFNSPFAIEGSLDNTQKIPERKMIAILRNCPNLNSLFLTYGIEAQHVDDDWFFDALNSHVFPHQPLLEKLGFEDSLKVGCSFNRDLKGTKLLNIDPLKKLQKLDLRKIDFNAGVLRLIQELPETIDLLVGIDCPIPIPKEILETLTHLKPTCMIVWDLTLATAGHLFPEHNLSLIQKIKCRQEVKIMFKGSPTDHQLLLLKPFESARLILLPYPPIIGLEERIKTLLPDLKCTIQDVADTDLNPFD